jgi:hypothetical protein
MFLQMLSLKYYGIVYKAETEDYMQSLQSNDQLDKNDFRQHMYAQGCHSDRRTDTSVTSDKVLIRQIRVNAMLISDKVKPELLCPRWLPRWMVGCKLPLYCTGCRAHSSMEGRTAAIGARTAEEWGPHG